MVDLSPPPPSRAAARTSDGVWFPIGQRLPRRDQRVRVQTGGGVVHVATFEVAYTDEWPAGVSWQLANGRAALALADVVAWSPTLKSPAAVAAAPVVAATRRPALAAELQDEVAETGAVLARIPPAHLDWSPHPAVPTLGVLACRLVRIVARVGWVLDLDALELAFEPDLPALGSVEAIVATYRANEATARGLAATVDAEALRAPWRLERHGELVAQMSRGEALRRFGLRPVVHHRAEAALMLAALGVPTPHPYRQWAFEDAAAPQGWGA